MATREQQLGSVLSDKINQMSEIQRRYFRGEMTRDQVNRLWMEKIISSDTRYEINAQFDQVDELRRLAELAVSSMKVNRNINNNSSNRFLFQQQQEIFQRQQELDQQINQQFHHNW